MQNVLRKSEAVISPAPCTQSPYRSSDAYSLHRSKTSPATVTRARTRRSDTAHGLLNQFWGNRLKRAHNTDNPRNVALNSPHFVLKIKSGTRLPVRFLRPTWIFQHHGLRSGLIHRKIESVASGGQHPLPNRSAIRSISFLPLFSSDRKRHQLTNLNSG